MGTSNYRSEIRDSTTQELLEKARKHSYGQYLISIKLEKIRHFRGAQINFDFPVTALIGPNGSGKSTILGAAGCAYQSTDPSNVFPKGRVGDNSMDDWHIEYELIDRNKNPKGSIKLSLSFRNDAWDITSDVERAVFWGSLNRTIPASESPLFTLRKRLATHSKLSKDSTIISEPVKNIEHIKREAERILGKSLASFQLVEVTVTRTKHWTEQFVRSENDYTTDERGNNVPLYKLTRIDRKKPLRAQQKLFIGSDGSNEYSEFNFGTGEASILHMIARMEELPENSLALIEELENGLHPIAVRRAVEYLIDVAKRKNAQIIFTTHSDYALDPLPPEAIWACLDGRLQQGNLSIEVLRAVSGRVDRKLVIFVEDDFAKMWLEAVLREKLSEHLDEIGVYPVSGDGNAVRVHLGHMSNPTISFHSLCFVDGDSKQHEDPTKKIFRLPGLTPETTIFSSVINNLDKNIALLTTACQRSSDKQGLVASAIQEVSRTNRDPHLLFNQVSSKIGYVPEPVVQGAFFSVWVQENPEEANKIAEPIYRALELPAKFNS